MNIDKINVNDPRKVKCHVIAVPTRVRVCGFKRKQSIIIMKKKVSTMYDNYFIIKVSFLVWCYYGKHK